MSNTCDCIYTNVDLTLVTRVYIALKPYIASNSCASMQTLTSPAINLTAYIWLLAL